MSIFKSCVIRQPGHFLFVVIIILLTGRPAASAAETSSGIYPLPLFELESVVKTWLKDSGYKISKISHDTGRADITTGKQGKTWTIHLSSRSSLVTEINVGTPAEKQTRLSELQDLWQYVADYVDPPSTGIGKVPQQVPDAIRSQVTSVVCITAVVNGNDFQVSGFFIDPKGYIICTAHNLSDTQTVNVIFHDGGRTTGNIKKISFYYDLALIQIAGGYHSVVSLDRGRNMLKMGERLFSIGCPVNLSGTIYAGIVNSPPRRTKDLPLWQVNMEIHPGSSGSPVFDIQGNLVAVIKGRFRGTESIGFLIPYETLAAFLND